MTYIYIVSNKIIRDTNGYAIGRKDPIIHSLNKSEIILSNYPDIYEKIIERKNVILLGDNLEDIHMIDGFSYKTLVSIGRCISNDEETKHMYAQYFDYVLSDNEDFHYVTNILEKVIQQ